MPVSGVMAAVCGVLALCRFRQVRKAEHPWKQFFAGARSGLLILIPAGAVMQYFGVPFGFNWFTICISVLLGIPGVLSAAVFSLFF